MIDQERQNEITLSIVLRRGPVARTAEERKFETEARKEIKAHKGHGSIELPSDLPDASVFRAGRLAREKFLADEAAAKKKEEAK
jgi:hypothetical protein